VNPTQRCDEIIKMIDEVLGAETRSDAHADRVSSPRSADDLEFALTQRESPR
jgi:hypothetical protein